MLPPRVAPRLLAPSGFACALLLSAAVRAEEPAARSNPITEGFHYRSAPDPDALPAELVRPTTPTGRERKRLSDPAARLPEVAINASPATPAPASPPASTPPAAAGETFVLPKLTVTGNKGKPPSLPRVQVDAPVKNLPEPEFESPSARADRLIQKHLTASERKFAGKSAAGQAMHREAVESAARELNRVAAMIELCAALGLEDEKSLKKLRAEFFKAYYERPR